MENFNRMIPRYKLSVVDRTNRFGETETDARLIPIANGDYVEYADVVEAMNETQKEVVPRWKFDALVAHCKDLERKNTELYKNQ
jgi:hypothetical protein